MCKTHPLNRYVAGIAATILTLTVIGAAAGEDPQTEVITVRGKSQNDFTPNTDLQFNVPVCSDEIRIDGRLDEPIWQTAARLDNFVEVSPGDNVEPTVQTEAFFTYDDKNLYVGFHCYDDDPSAIRASITDRDNIFQDDFIGIMIDTFRDEQNGFEFFVNPHGIQGDLRRNRNNEDSSYDTVWYSGGRVTEDGWTAEMAIPFRSVRFPDSDVQTWGVHVLRIRPRDSREQHSWAPMSRDESCTFCQAGQMTGMTSVAAGSSLEILPYVIGSQGASLDTEDDVNYTWNNQDFEGDAGVGLKYGITSNYTLDFTYNPDFSQIESDAAQIDVNNTFALFFPERRPFFLEGADLFDTKINAVYTRSVNSPIAAGKVTGKSDQNAVGFMSAMDTDSPYIVPLEEASEVTQGGETYTNMFRAKRDVLTESFVGALVTDRRSQENGGINTVAGVDWRLRFLEDYGFEAQVLGSYTREPDDEKLSEEFEDNRFGHDDEYTAKFDGEEFNGYGVEASINRSARHYNFWLWYDDFSPTFRAENGFVSSNNFRRAGFWNGYQFQPENHPVFERIQPQFGMGQVYNHQNVFKDEWFEPSIWVRFKKQTSIWTGYVWSNERFADTYVGGIRRWQGNFNTSFHSMFSGGFFWRIGRSIIRDTDAPRLGNQQTFETWLTLKPTAQLQWRVNYNSFKMNELSGEPLDDVYVLRSRVTYQFNRQLFLRLITQYVDSDHSMSVDPLLSYKINPFTVFFVGSSHSLLENATPLDAGYTQTDRVYFVKFQYLFRV